MPDNKPPESFNVGGTRPTGQFRARPTWFGLVVVEQLWESSNGEKHWAKIEWPVPLMMEG